ncbi:MAG: SRPBCC family protein [Pseudomonadota bacterium]
MELNIKQDIDAPIAFVFEQMTDFDAHERRAVMAGLSVIRTAQSPDEVIWKAAFDFRGKIRKVDLRLYDIIAPEQMLIELKGQQLEMLSDAKLIELSPELTRLRLKLSMTGKTLKARLLVQSARLAKQNIIRRLQSRLAGLASEIEDEYLEAR